MKRSTSIMLLAAGLSVATLGGIVSGAVAQSQPDEQYQSDDLDRSETQDSTFDTLEREPDRYDDGALRDDRRNSRDGFRHRRHRTGFGRGHRRGGRFMRRFDIDGNGNVTQAEFDAGMNKKFARLDLDGDGTITREEFRQRRHRRHYD